MPSLLAYLCDCNHCNLLDYDQSISWCSSQSFTGCMVALMKLPARAGHRDLVVMQNPRFYGCSQALHATDTHQKLQMGVVVLMCRVF